jgi:hypothetical protein
MTAHSMAIGSAVGMRPCDLEIRGISYRVLIVVALATLGIYWFRFDAR